MLNQFDSPPPSSPSGKVTAVTLSLRTRIILFSAVFSFQLFLLLSALSFSPPRFFTSTSSTTTVATATTAVAAAPTAPECNSGKVFVYDLPPSFNKDFIDNCHELNPWKSRCNALSNAGYGQKSTDLVGIVPDSLLHSWFATDQFAAELIYHNRMLSHPCRTLTPTDATAFYIPFYAGLAVGKHLWSANSTSDERDRACRDILRWIKNQDPYLRSNGADHFIMLGRITWDFRRSNDEDWGGSFIYMTGMENVTRLLIERNPWDEKDIGVPYPTGFHPKSVKEMEEWQRFVSNRNRSKLFSFAGAARTEIKNDFRGILLDQCARAEGTCRSVDCGGGRCGNRSRETLSLFLDSNFCLQPRGDSYTRRSMFDCMVAGAIPVIFWKQSAYVQYTWFLPEDLEEWSVFIDRREVRSGNVSVRGVLEGIGEDKVRRMRERVVEILPRLVYGGGEQGIGGGMRDAFDVAVEGVMGRFREGKEEGEEVGAGSGKINGEDGML